MTNALIPYTPREPTWEEQCDHIIAELCTGRSVSSILRDDEGMPKPTTFWSRMFRDDELYAKISRAREFGQHAILEQAMDMAMTPLDGEEITIEIGPDGVRRRVTTRDMLGHRKLAIDTMIKRAQMIAPRNYGDRAERDETGEKVANIIEAIAMGRKRLESRVNRTRGEADAQELRARGHGRE
jgi:hypothetical protein